MVQPLPLPSVAKALALPELLTSILDCLSGDMRHLAQAARVNKQWFSCGTNVLWRHASCEALANVPDDRRHIYAAKITSLTFSGGEEALYHERFRNLEFSSLRHISLDAYRPADYASYPIRQYFQPPLESFSFYGGHLDHDLLDQLRSQAWRLRTLLIDSPGPHVEASFFLDFISRYKSLQHIKFLYGMDHLVTDDLILHLAQRSDLLQLEIGKTCSEQLLELVSSRIAHPFRDLRAIHIALTSAAVPSAAKLFPRVTYLGLDVRDAGVNVMQSLSSLSALRHFALTFAADTRLSLEELLSLKKLSRLQELTIEPNERETDPTVTALEAAFSDKHFDDIVSHLPSLRRLSFLVQCTLSAAALLSLAKHCPLLEECNMLPVFDIRMLESEARRNSPLFPKLRFLEVGGFRPSTPNGEQSAEQTPPQDLIDLMKKSFPKLKELYVSADDEYSAAVADEFSASDSD
ncbi:hypothetical protein HRG_008942 [Hirsutella rhossiliensis]|uniref:F-box domain-containing protein n=1 Tax=Hirsutella rhossiliensis TaxID=111463 RepID=A0A9P8MTH1_9HYPO|nr:uncharacterized protein HRG_08942 [Hirsutella rhossiliensis]KAH0959921.1 hypothetical protein HRG_08942 [Hirsutella rhossiliensis]